MAYETATATDYKDLLRRVRKFVLGYGVAGTPSYSGTGDGTLTGLATFPATVTETWTLVCTAGGPTGTFSVTGSVSGAQAAATVGTPYSNSFIAFTLNDGAADFVPGDQFTIAVTAGAMPGVQRWIDQRWVDAGGDIEWIFRAPGLAGADEIYGGMRSYENVGLDYYNLAIIGATGFVSGNSFQTQPGASPERHLMMWNQPITYWLVANGRRLVLVYKITTYYGSCYLGHFLPYGTPQQYPYPLAVGGMTYLSGQRYSTVNAYQNKTPFDPGGDGGYVNAALSIYHIDGSWQGFCNYYTSGSPDSYRTGVNHVWPHGWEWVRNNVDGSYALFPLILNMNSPAINLLGEFDGVYWISGFANGAENTVTIGADTYLVFQDGHRTGAGNYRALKLA